MAPDASRSPARTRFPIFDEHMGHLPVEPDDDHLRVGRAVAQAEREGERRHHDSRVEDVQDDPAMPVDHRQPVPVSRVERDASLLGDPEEAGS